jgi:hypothetical protein
LIRALLEFGRELAHFCWRMERLKKENPMRLAITAAALAVCATTLPTPSVAQYQHCIAGRGCVPATQASYDACFHLALQRGLTVTVGDKRNLDLFIYQCLDGRIPR